MKTTAENFILMGKYKQDNAFSDGKEPIAWRVLAVENGKALLFSDKILDSKSYHNIEFMDITWENCTLRNWLNSEFYNAAFSTTEKAEIITTRLKNKGDPDYSTVGGNETVDNVFLLSYSDVTNPDYGFSPEDTTLDSVRCAQCTEFAKSNGLWVSDKVSSIGKCHWWLRSPGIDNSDAGLVRFDGYVTSSSVCTTGVGIRPAIWIKCDTEDGSEEVDITYENGCTYTGTLLNGERNGFGSMTYIVDGEFIAEYVGYWSHSEHHGEGTQTFENGTKLTGEFMNGKLHGNGTVVLPDGTKSTGEFMNNELHGNGTVVLPDGRKSTGEFMNNVLHGNGTMVLPDGTKSTGEFMNNELHGNCTVVFPDGSKHMGEWANGTCHGYGKMDFIDGKEYVGEWSNGLPHGQGKMTYADGRCENGEWENGVFMG